MKNFFPAFTTEITAFLQYCKNPVEHFDEKLNFTSKYRIFNILLIFSLLIITVIIIPAVELADRLVKLQYTEELDEMNVFVMLFFAVVIAPVFEELIFRLPLKWNRNVPGLLLHSVFPALQLKKIWRRFYGAIFYVIALLFGLVHLLNYENEWNVLFIAFIPIIVSSQILVGFVLGYVRNRLGFFWSVIMHAVSNFILLTVPFVLYDGQELFSIDNQGFSVEAKYHPYKNLGEEIELGKQGDTIYLIDAKNISLESLTEITIGKRYSSEEVKYLDFKLISQDGMSSDELYKILNKELQLRPAKKKDNNAYLFENIQD